jgi:YARHG domain-containing protein
MHPFLARFVVPSVTCFGVTAGVLIIGVSPSTRPVRAQAYPNMSCDQLWYARNEIFAARGYCFKTPKAQEVFGKGCFPPYGELQEYESREVKRIRQWEKRKGC